MQGVIKKWGNSAAVRIPSAIMSAAQVQLDQPVTVREEGGRIIIEPQRPAAYDLDTLLAAITDNNRHEAIETGNPIGQEVW